MDHPWASRTQPMWSQRWRMWKVLDLALSRLQMLTGLLMNLQKYTRRRACMITAVPGMKTDPQSLQHSNLKLPHADRVIPGHLVEMDQLQVGGKLSTLVVELGVDTWEDISISLKARRPQRQKQLLISSFVHLGNMKDIQVWMVVYVSFGQDVC